MSHTDSPLEAYLDELFLQVAALPPREARQLMSEAEAHLRDDVEHGMASGLSEVDAERAAIARFGSASALATAEARRQSVPLRSVVRQVFSSALLLGAIGALAIGASGLIALGIRAFGGDTALTTVPPGRVLSSSDCARWLAANPTAPSCRSAAISDWAAEIVYYRLAVGVLGVIALLLFLGLRRVTSVERRWTTLPASVMDTVALCLFAVAGLWTLALGLDALATSHGDGSGQWLSAAPVALAAAAAYALRLLADVRRPAP
jgi:hypothetical protein